MLATVADAFWSRVAFSQAGCWNWTGCKSLLGYGKLKIDGKYWMAHRFAYNEVVDTLPRHEPKGYELDHLCRNPSCVRPDHLELVTHRENVLRGVATSAIHAKKTYCPVGHPLYGPNLYVPPSGNVRMCRACRKVQSKHGNRKRYKAKREDVLAYQRAWYAKNGRKKP